jgi:hypothetical protein
MVTPPGGGQPLTQDIGSKLEDIVRAARPHRTNGKIHDLEEILTQYEYIFARAIMGGLTRFRNDRTPTISQLHEENTPRETSRGKIDARQSATTCDY